MKQLFWIIQLLICLCHAGTGQETWFFSEGTSGNFYDQGIVDKGNLGSSSFEYTYPPGYPQYNDKVPCSSTAWKGNTSLKFNYTSSAGGNWRVTIYRSDWSATDISAMDSLVFHAFSTSEVPDSALPLIAIRTLQKSGSGEGNSKLYPLSRYNKSIPAGKWTRITFPLEVIRSDPENSGLSFAGAKGIIFNQSEKNNTSRLILIDEIMAFKSLASVPPVSVLTATGYDSHAELTWTAPAGNLSYRIYASFNGGSDYELRGETNASFFLDFVTPAGRNKTVKYRVVSFSQVKESLPSEASATLKDYTDDELLDMVERYTFRYFWEGAHQNSGMVLERSNGSSTTAASGATGMGLMAMLAAHEREYRPRDEIRSRILKILTFLETCDRYHGAWSHWYDAGTGKTVPFSTYDDGGDLVETSFVAQALLALRNFFTGSDATSVLIRQKADLLWKGIEWDWYRQGNQNVLYWHWSPNYGFRMNMKITGWNECLVTYLMAASSPAHAIPKEVYTSGWARNGLIVNKRSYYGYEINLSPDWGGPLFWIHYSHLGINPQGLKDPYADYWKEHVNTVKIHQAYAVANPKGWKNYSEKCWGLTASDDPAGYTAHQPTNNDNGTISPTAALSSLPYLPAEVLKALKYFYRERGKELFGLYGFYDAFNDQLSWVKKAYLGIDQGPVIVMIENYRTGLIWNNVMTDPDLQAGLKKLDFTYIPVAVPVVRDKNHQLRVYPNPAADKVFVNTAEFRHPVRIMLFSPDGRLLVEKQTTGNTSLNRLDLSNLTNGYYWIRISDQKQTSHSQLIIQK